MSWIGDMLLAGIKSDGKAIQLVGLGGGMGAKLLGAGNSTSQATDNTNGMNFIEFRFSHKGSSGNNRGLYLRTYFSGGAGGDCARIFSTVSASAGTVYGAHISLNFDSGKVLSGEGIANRCTLHVPDEVVASGGTLAALQAEIYMDGNSADPSAVTQMSLMRFVVAGGNATARDRIKKLFTIEGVTSGASNLFQAGQNEPTWAGKTCLIRILVAGTPMNLIAVDPS